MRILIFGGDGMLGHQLIKSWRHRHEVWATLHRGQNAYERHDLFPPERTIFDTDVCQEKDLKSALDRSSPQVVVNAVGIVKQQALAAQPLPSIQINALLPHRLAQLCAPASARLIHMSTDCVFSGRKGMYTEKDPPDPVDLYGRTKVLGEIAAPNTVTLRTSMIGTELSRKRSLIEWYLSQSGSVPGFTKAIFSGLTTEELARVIERLLVDEPKISGVWHVSSSPISKYDLLCRLTELLGREDIRVEPDDSCVCDRSLDSTALSRVLGYEAPHWDRMLEELTESIRRRKHVA